ncbi:MAG: HAD-IIB family hydrolase [Maritimibacter sp.]
MPNQTICIFTDLDGTLLDHESYDYAPALPLLRDLTARGIPVVLTSSKTPSELIALRAEMGLEGSPAICENGAGIVQAGSRDLPDNSQWTHICSELETVSAVLRRQFRGFGDMSVDEVAEATGLPAEDASRAAQRCFTEPGIWLGSDAERDAFIAELAAKGITARSGGRFLTLGPNITKADRMEELIGQMGKPTSIALGDAPNDVEMLSRASYGILIPNPHRAKLPKFSPDAEKRIIHAGEPGPKGWAAALSALLMELQLT